MKAPMLHVLVIEDNQYFAQVLCDILEIKGCVTAYASTAERGLEMTKELQPEIVFCDIELHGGASGLDFARSVRADKESTDLPLIAISGYASDDDQQAALEAGFNFLLAKPVRFADLSRIVDRYSGTGRARA